MQHATERISSYALTWVGRPIAIAGFFVLVALLWSFPLQHVMAYPFLFLFFGAVMFSAWFGGFVAGIVAAALSSLLVTFFFIPPLYSFAVGVEFRGYEAAFILCAIAITMISAARRRVETAIRSANDELDVRVRQRTAELQLANLELQERETHLRTLTEAIPQQIWRSDASGTLEYCNGDLLDYLGVPVMQERGPAFADMFHQDDLKAFETAWEQARRSGSKFESKARVRASDGSYRWFLIRGSPQIAENGAIARWYAVHIDIEEQERSLRELLIAQERLAALARNFTMAEMAASIAHQLRQPLTAITTEAHACRRWLQAQPPNLERAAATAEHMVSETVRASAVVDRVRSLFSRTDYRREPADINGIIMQLVRVLRDEANRRNISLKLRLDDALVPIIVDPVQIEQVLLNLVMNSMEAMASDCPQREIEVATELSGAEVVISVCDHGVGIPSAIKDRIFEPFFTTKPAGTGMGLAVCRTVVEEHEGRIWAETSNAGTAIRFTLKTSQS